METNELFVQSFRTNIRIFGIFVSAIIIKELDIFLMRQRQVLMFYQSDGIFREANLMKMFDSCESTTFRDKFHPYIRNTDIVSSMFVFQI